MRLIPGILSIAFTAFSAASFAASFDDYPVRAPGLWVITTSLNADEAEDNRAEVKQTCLGVDTDRIYNQQTAAFCTLPVLTKKGDRVDYTMVCEHDGTTVTTEGYYVGDFDTAYTATIKVTAEPPIPGVSNSTVVQKAQRLGDCKPGQSPGDIILPGFESAE